VRGETNRIGQGRRTHESESRLLPCGEGGVSWGSGTLTVASTRTGRRLGVVAAGAEPHHFAFGLGSLWVSDHGGGTLVRVDPRRRRVRGRTPVGPEPHHVAVAGSRVLVAVHESGMSRS
jgi:DNA-binding beta-propeller fold protein YncE